MRVRLHSLGWRNIERARQIIDDRIDQILHADVLQSRTADDGHKFVRNRLPPNCSLQKFGRDRLFFENNLRDLVVDIRNLLDQFFVSLVDRNDMFLGDVRDLVCRSKLVAI